jgi:hypothetical protein
MCAGSHRNSATDLSTSNPRPFRIDTVHTHRKPTVQENPLKTLTAAASLIIASVGFTLPAFAGDCALHYERIACKGQEAESFKKCDGKPGCDKTKPASSAEECAAAALKSCDNDRLDITKFKAITASYDGKALVGGFDAAGKPNPAGPNFCAANRADMNKCD